MKKKFNTNFSKGISMIFYERLFEIVILFLFALLIVSRKLDNITLIALELTALIIGMLILFYYKSDALFEFLNKIVSKHLKRESYSLSLKIQKVAPHVLVLTFTITLLSLISEFIRLWFVIFAFGLKLELLDLAIAISISVIIGLISQIPLGIGAMEGSLSVLLERVGVPQTYSLSAVLIDRAISMYFVLIMGYIVSCFSLKEVGEFKEENE